MHSICEKHETLLFPRLFILLEGNYKNQTKNSAVLRCFSKVLHAHPCTFESKAFLSPLEAILRIPSLCFTMSLNWKNWIYIVVSHKCTASFFGTYMFQHFFILFSLLLYNSPVQYIYSFHFIQYLLFLKSDELRTMSWARSL